MLQAALRQDAAGIAMAASPAPCDAHDGLRVLEKQAVSVRITFIHHTLARTLRPLQVAALMRLWHPTKSECQSMWCAAWLLCWHVCLQPVALLRCTPTAACPCSTSQHAPELTVCAACSAACTPVTAEPGSQPGA